MMVLFWELKFFDLMVRHHAGVMSENHKRGWNFANSHNLLPCMSISAEYAGKPLIKNNLYVLHLFIDTEVIYKLFINPFLLCLS